jgi:hypothetical protein
MPCHLTLECHFAIAGCDQFLLCSTPYAKVWTENVRVSATAESTAYNNGIMSFSCEFDTTVTKPILLGTLQHKRLVVKAFEIKSVSILL